MGLSEFSVEVTSLGLRRATLADLRMHAGPGAAKAEVAGIELRYSLESLVERRLEHVEVAGLRLSARLQGDPGTGSASAVPHDRRAIKAASLPFDSMILADTRLTLHTDSGEVHVSSDFAHALAANGAFVLEVALGLQLEDPRVAARMRLRGRWGPDGALGLGPVDCIMVGLPAAWFEGPLHVTPPRTVARPLCLRGAPGTSLRMKDPLGNPGDFDLALALDPLHLSGRIGEGREATAFEIEVPEVRMHVESLSSMARPELRLSATGGRVELPGQALAIEEVAFDASISPDAPLPSGSLVLGRIVDLAVPARFAPLASRGQFAPVEDSVRFGFDVGDIDGLLHLRIDGQYAPTAGAGSLEFALDPLLLDDLWKQLTRISPMFEDRVSDISDISDISGRVDLDGQLRWRPDALDTEFFLQLGDLGWTASWGQVSGIAASFSLLGFEPLHMTGPQRVTVERFSGAVDLTNGLVDLWLRRDGIVEVPQVQWDLAGGRVRTHGLYDPSADHNEFTVEATGIDLQTLLELLNIDGLTGEGTLAGIFPVYVAEDGVEIRNGELVSVSPGGWLRYRPSGAASAMVTQDSQLQMLTELLEDFRFESLVIALNGNVLGNVQAAVHLEGANPGFQEGTPVEFNLGIEAALADLFRRGAAGFSLAEDVVDRLQEGR